MTCPHCFHQFDSHPDVCPACGIRIFKRLAGVMRTSTVLIAAGQERGLYRSVRDVPEPWRTRLIETTNSPNAGTIVIADQAGRRQLAEEAERAEGAIPAKDNDAARETEGPDHAVRHRGVSPRGMSSSGSPVGAPAGSRAVNSGSAESLSAGSRVFPPAWTGRGIAWAGFAAVLCAAGILAWQFGLRW